MYTITFYKDAKGNQPVKEYIELLRNKKDKSSRIKLNKIEFIISNLQEYGIDLGMPYIRRINNDLWEMRPIRDRIFFFSYKNNELVLLHYFLKKTDKTPTSEIDKAMYEMNYYIEWRKTHDKRKL